MKQHFSLDKYRIKYFGDTNPYFSYTPQLGEVLVGRLKIETMSCEIRPMNIIMFEVERGNFDGFIIPAKGSIYNITTGLLNEPEMGFPIKSIDCRFPTEAEYKLYMKKALI